METFDVIEVIHRNAVALGMATTREPILGRETVIARRSDFKLRWAATRLHTFVVAAAFAGSATPPELDAFLDAARGYAVDHKGGMPRGLQTGSAAIAVAVVAGHDAEMERWALQPHGRRFAALAFPVLADVTSRVVLEPKRMLLGGIYAKHLRNVVSLLVQL